MKYEPANCSNCEVRPVRKSREISTPHVTSKVMTKFWYECPVCHKRGPESWCSGDALHQWNKANGDVILTLEYGDGVIYE